MLAADLPQSVGHETRKRVGRAAQERAQTGSESGSPGAQALLALPQGRKQFQQQPPLRRLHRSVLFVHFDDGGDGGGVGGGDVQRSVQIRHSRRRKRR